MKLFKNFFLILIVALFTQHASNAQTNKKKGGGQQQNNGKNDTPVSAPKISRKKQIEPKGIYVATDWAKPVPEYVLNSSDIDGVFLRMGWNQFQTAPDQYDWKFIDSELSRIQKAGKQASFGIAAGMKCPDWIYTTGGVKSVEFSEIPNNGRGKKLLPIKLPVVWDAKFLTIWTKFISDLATHLKSEPKLYACITQVKITGINLQTIETRQPSEKSVTNGTLTSTDAYAIWKTAGYKPQLIKDAWQTITNCFSANFKDKIINLAIIPHNGFPFIDDNGNETTHTPDNDLTRWLVNDGCTRFGQQFAVQFNALGATTGTSKIVAGAAQLGYISGYQIEEVDYGNPNCLNAKTPCDENEFKTVLDRGFQDGVQFIEIFIKDVDAFPKSVKYGNTKMKTTD